MQTRFHRFLFAYTLYSFTYWASIAALPLLLKDKFGLDGSLVMSLALRMLPRVFCAPLISQLLLKIGARLTSIAALIGLAVATSILPHIDHFQAFQAMNIGMGIISMGVVASLMTLRSQVLPVGDNITANAAFVTIERMAQILGPLLTGMLLTFCTITYSFYAIALLLLIATLVICTVQDASTSIQSSSTFPSSYTTLLRIFSASPILWVIFLPALGYAIVLGGINTFLLWSTIETFKKPEGDWVFLLTAHGIGAIIGSLIAPHAIAFLRSRIMLVHIYLWARLFKLLWLVGLVQTTQFEYAAVLLAVSAVFEVIGSVCFLTIIQTTLTNSQEAVFHALSGPIFNTFVVLGTSCSWAYTSHWLTLGEFWLLTVFLGSIPIVYYLLFTDQRRDIASQNI